MMPVIQNTSPIEILQQFELVFLLLYFIPKVIVATICGSFIGIERELKSKAAGLKTNIAVCVGSTLFTATSLLVIGMSSNTASDVNRVVAQIVSGIGFLGAGAIVKSSSKSVAGLTTASFIWLLGAMGVLVGCGGYKIALILTAGFVMMTLVVSKVEEKIKEREN